MFDLELRHVKDALLEPLAHLLSPFSPNTLSVLSLSLGLVSAWYCFRGEFLISLFCWLLNRILDGVDGLVARLYHKSTDFGGYLDILCDFIVYSTIPLAFGLQNPSNYRWTVLCSLMATYFVNAASLFQLSAILEKRLVGASRSGEKTVVTMPRGFIEGAETVLFYTVFLSVPEYGEILWTLFAVCVSVTVIQRVIWAWKNLHFCKYE